MRFEDSDKPSIEMPVVMFSGNGTPGTAFFPEILVMVGAFGGEVAPDMITDMPFDQVPQLPTLPARSLTLNPGVIGSETLTILKKVIGSCRNPGFFDKTSYVRRNGNLHLNLANAATIVGGDVVKINVRVV